MREYEIELEGCDDDTQIVVKLTEVEAAVVARVADLLTAASECDCMPRMFIKEVNQ